MKAEARCGISRLIHNRPDAAQALDATSEITRELSEILDESPTAARTWKKVPLDESTMRIKWRRSPSTTRR